MEVCLLVYDVLVRVTGRIWLRMRWNVLGFFLFLCVKDTGDKELIKNAKAGFMRYHKKKSNIWRLVAARGAGFYYSGTGRMGGPGRLIDIAL